MNFQDSYPNQDQKFGALNNQTKYNQKFEQYQQYFDTENIKLYRGEEEAKETNIFVELSKRFQSKVQHEEEEEEKQGYFSGIRELTSNISSHDVFFFFFTSGIGILFIVVSFFFLPVLVIAPHKFCTLFGLGSASIFYSIIYLKGFKGTLLYFWKSKRRWNTISYAITLILLMYYSLINKSFFWVIVFSIIQLLILINLLFGIIPGGSTTLKWTIKGCCYSMKGFINCCKGILRVLC